MSIEDESAIGNNHLIYGSLQYVPRNRTQSVIDDDAVEYVLASHRPAIAKGSFKNFKTNINNLQIKVNNLTDRDSDSPIRFKNSVVFDQELLDLA